VAWHQNSLELCHLHLPVNKVARSWHTVEAEDSLIFTKIYRHFS
jgi:hypothetical protein